MCLARHCIKYSLVFAYHFISGGERQKVCVCQGERERVCLCLWAWACLVQKTTKLDWWWNVKSLLPHTHKSNLMPFIINCSTDSPILCVPLKKGNHMGLKAGVNNIRFLFYFEVNRSINICFVSIALISFFVFVCHPHSAESHFHSCR